jgi:hypothetical protein
MQRLGKSFKISQLLSAKAKILTQVFFIQFLKFPMGTAGVVQVVEYLPSKREALSSNSNIALNK